MGAQEGAKRKGRAWGASRRASLRAARRAWGLRRERVGRWAGGASCTRRECGSRRVARRRDARRFESSQRAVAPRTATTPRCTTQCHAMQPCTTTGRPCAARCAVHTERAGSGA